MDGELREFYKELGNSGNFVSLLFPQLEPFRIFKTPLYFAKPLFLVAFAAFPCPLHPALLTLSLCLKRFVFAFFFFLRGCVICCWSETLFLVFFFFVIDNVSPGAWYRFFSLLPELFVCLLSYHRKIFWNKNGSVAAAVFSNPCASRALKLESSHRRTNRRRRNRIETGGFLLDSHQQLSFLLLVNLLEIFLHLVR